MRDVKVSDWIAEYLAEQGVTRVYELIGGMIVHMVDAIHRQGRIELVSVRHEQAAAFAADAEGRITRIPGVAMATSGPGATNLLTGIGSCHFDSSPAVFITGQVNRHEQRGDRGIRQLGFQETDIVAMAAPITKGAVRVETPEEVPALLEWAFTLATQGRPGPVLVDIPMDVQGAILELPDPARAPEPPRTAPDPQAANDLLAALARAKRPLVLAGAGVRASGAIDELRTAVNQLGVPVVHSLLAVDVLPYEHTLRVGLIGSYGNRWGNWSIGEADLLLVVGARLDIRQTGSEVEAFKGERVIFHVDAEAVEINQRVPGCRSVVADARAFLAELCTRTDEARGLPSYAAWREEIAAKRAEWPDTAELPDIEGLNPNVLMHELSAVSDAAGAFVVDVGQHQQWAAQSLELTAQQRFLTSGGMGAMGFSLPAAIGAALSTGKPVVVIAGDGCFQLNLQELESVAHRRLPLKIVVVDNGCHGMVRQFQQSYFDGRYQSTVWGYSAPDFSRVAQAFGIGSARVDAPEDLAGALAQLWADPSVPFLLTVSIDLMANAYPKLAFGRPVTEMEPFAQPIAMEGT
ncbi:MAG: thiamine pyrophosphate-binding protein [Actinomycetota bacterium]|nr:thiamine pyrophosphate-binding protein [Actinomycetota bacterium]